MSQAADRALDLLERVARSDEPLGLMELAGRSGLDKTTTARLLGFLAERGLVSRDAATRKYAVGPALLSLAAVAMRRSDLRNVAAPHLEQLRDASGETVSLHLRVGDERICLHGVESRHAVRRVAPVGEPLPLWVGPSGKAILAFVAGPDGGALLGRAAAAGVDADRLRAQLDSVRRRGYLAAIGDRTAGVGAISVPLFAAAGPAGSITVAGPGDRWTLERMEAFAPELVATAAAISAALGGQTA